MTDRVLLDADQIDERLAGVPEWKHVGTELVRSFEFRDFVEAFGFLSMVGLIAESMNHHPELSNTYNRVRLAITTHDRGGITALDFDFAERVDAALGEA